MKKEIWERLTGENISSVVVNAAMKIRREHQERRRRWISAAHDVAELSKNSNARAIVRFLKKRSIAGMVDSSVPPGCGFIPCQASRMKNPIIFVVPNAGEECLRTKDSYGTFFSKINVLAIPNEPLSSFARGMITLHEGHHALWFRKEGYKVSKDANQEVKDIWHAIDEYYAQGLELEILFQIGGVGFQEIISETYDRYVWEVYEEPNGSFTLPPPRDFSKELTAIFGRSLSEREDIFRASWISRAAGNMYVDYLYPNDPEAAFKMKVGSVVLCRRKAVLL